MAGKKKKKGKGRRGSKAIPVVQLAILGYPTLSAVQSLGFSEAALNKAVYDTTGINTHDIRYSDPKKGIYMGIALLAVTKLGGKLANMSGANRWVKKATGGMLKIA